MLTQSMLARALSDDSRVAVATISSWESLTNPKLPPADRLRSYALFFCTDRSTEGTPHLIPENQLTPEERTNFHALHHDLIALRDAVRGQGGGPSSSPGGSYTWDFESGPITIICPEAPVEGRSPLAAETHANFTRMYRYADLDALIELWGHIRASNPDLKVNHRLPSEVVADDMSGHVVVLGGIAWNQVTKRLLKTLSELPVSQVGVEDLNEGEIFRASGPGGGDFRPLWEEFDDGTELAEDVALLARVRNPFNHSRTVTICNGIYSRGVLGAVRVLSDAAVRERNEAFLSREFPDGLFALLLRVPVMNGEAISPDLEIAENRLYQWSPDETQAGR
ncbi:hypothetical protein [Kribbella sp. CA-293567]|uniref:hypothetical protein n=1 Tax=Kribbella sp. CA-293567 TaxID=3002436 RepID=UPI0022DD98F0|nr:hypothetical protein [Kribbella sp. CA-293567]WBQ04820.1 hypothetical protein OX958_33285 [Kribbella sp. CA-293567]